MLADCSVELRACYGAAELKVACAWVRPQTMSYRQAAFCYEELLMMAPTNSIYHTRYADVLYTVGGPTNLK